MASILSGHTGTLPVAPSRRIAAGLSVGTIANTEPLVFADHAPDAQRHWPAPDVRVSLDQKPCNKRFRSKPRAKTRASGARKNS
jgi:hypothetical protein